jgi:hypothetical protein
MPFEKSCKRAPTAGRQRGTTNKNTAAIKELAFKDAPDVIKELARLALHSTNEAVRVSAAKELLDRAIGKAFSRSLATLAKGRCYPGDHGRAESPRGFRIMVSAPAPPLQRPGRHGNRLNRRAALVSCSAGKLIGAASLLAGDEEFAFIPLFHARMLLVTGQTADMGRHITRQFAHRDETVVVFIGILA